MNKIKKICTDNKAKWIDHRRILHKHPELGFMEYFTASYIAKYLDSKGFSLIFGETVSNKNYFMNYPSNIKRNEAYIKAINYGVENDWISKFNHNTSFIAKLENGNGPTVAFRFEMDALPIIEASDKSHRPFIENFISKNKGVMHACGHDGHLAVSLALADLIVEFKESFKGTILFIFQAAEEGVRGALSICKTDALKNIDYLFSHHIVPHLNSNTRIIPYNAFSATEKWNVHIIGEEAHAGFCPNQGSNAILAASVIIQNLYSIPRHKAGITRINVGKINGGSARNIICGNIVFEMELRGENNDILNYLKERSKSIIENCSNIYNCSSNITVEGFSESAFSSSSLSTVIKEISLDDFSVISENGTGGSEDFSLMLNSVQNNNGLGLYIGCGANFNNNNFLLHSNNFDFDEDYIPLTAEFFMQIILTLLK